MVASLFVVNYNISNLFAFIHTYRCDVMLLYIYQSCINLVFYFGLYFYFYYIATFHFFGDLKGRLFLIMQLYSTSGFGNPSSYLSRRREEEEI